MSDIVAADLLAALAPTADRRTIREVREEACTDSTGAASGGVVRMTVVFDADGERREDVLIRKTLRPVPSGPHAERARDERHWAYWRRELLFYASTLIQNGPHLTSPRCLAVTEDTVYLEDVGDVRESPTRAAANLARWQTTTRFPDLPWLTSNQLLDRVAARDLDWTIVNADPRLQRVWEGRHRLLTRLEEVPLAPSHGDFSHGNLRATARGTIALDWAAVGHAPLGADCATLALSVDEPVLEPYRSALPGHVRGAASRGYHVTFALTGAGRIHWMLCRGLDVPDGYTDAVCDSFASQ